MITNNARHAIIQMLVNPPFKHLSNTLSLDLYAKGYATRTQISIGSVQDLDTLIEQSPNYSNRAVTKLL